MTLMEQIGVALGLSSVAGVNLYLTVLMSGLTMHFNAFQLAEKHAALAVLGEPVVLWVAGVLCAIEFLADKVPWIDSAWDSIHTFIRPLGGALLGLQAMGQTSPELQVVIGLLAGGASLTTHTAKAGTRLLVNHSPEPVSNIALSVGEDLSVMGMLVLIATHPVIAFCVCVAVLSVLWIVIPKIFRQLCRCVKWLKKRFGKATYQGHNSAA
jgi:hypothetical protein